MKSAKELLNSKKVLIEKKRIKNAELINEELLDIEKALNKYESDLENTKPYIEIDRLIKTDEVKNLLKEKGYIIDTIGAIKKNTTRIWIDEEKYNKNHPSTTTIKNTVKINEDNKKYIALDSKNKDIIENLFKDIYKSSGVYGFR
ncbi:TPA: hypothetical protein LA460_000095 [Clostridium botulinum]|nr:hypothetical protein [Clostridium botulinum]HBJ1652700.1 hypothetical protein [Clostridium botulinum]